MPRPSSRSRAVRVARIITRLNVGGPSIQAITLTERLAGRGVTTRLLHGRLGPGEGDMRYMFSADADVEYVHRLTRAVSPADDLAALARLTAILRDFQPHIVHTHTAKAGAIGRLAALAYNRTAGRHRPARLVHTYHGHVLDGYFGALKTRVFVHVERALARVTDRIVAISPAIRDELVGEHRIGRAAQYRVIPLGFDLAPLAAIHDSERETARTALEIPTTAHVVTTVGRLTAIKQHRLFLETAREIARSDSDALFLIAGDGELRNELEAAARAFGIGERTRFLGWRRDLAAIYAASDVFLLTSRNEGTPVALIESLAAGVPAVSTDVGGVRDVLADRDAGVLAAVDDRTALTSAVSGLLRDAARRRSMGERGRADMLARYGVERLVDDVEGLYRELVE
jgi:glycosyltransferase involved in cell wall biosynthesis